MTKDDIQKKISQSSHDMKNIMTSIHAYGQLMKRRLDKGETTSSQELLQKLNTQISRLSDALVDYTDWVKKL